ncbi:MAG TPA: WD40 repeat domain-containing protein [Chloroflexota bacterium]|jgi:WD40 repeat protein
MPGVTRADPAPALAPLWRAAIGDHVNALAWAPRGGLLAAAAVSGPVTLFDGATGEARHTLSGHGFGSTALAWSADSARLATAGQDGCVRLWDVAHGAAVRTLDGGAAWVEHLAWNPNGTLLASAAGRRLRLWDAAGDLVREYPEQPSTIAAIAWQPRAQTLASAAYGVMALWTPDQPEPRRRFEWKGSILTLAWSPDARYIATGDQDSTVHFWMVKSGQDLQMWGYPRKVRELAWDGTSRYLATGGGPVVVVCDCSGKGPEGTKPKMLDAHTAPLSALACQRAGPLLASAGEDGQVVVWELGRWRKPRAQYDLGEPLSHVAWAPDDRILAVGGAGGTVAVLPSP